MLAGDCNVPATVSDARLASSLYSARAGLRCVETETWWQTVFCLFVYNETLQRADIDTGPLQNTEYICVFRLPEVMSAAPHLCENIFLGKLTFSILCSIALTIEPSMSCNNVYIDIYSTL